MHPELPGIVEDFERLWTVAGFAERFAANLARPGTAAVPGDPYDLVLKEHHRRLVAAFRRRSSAAMRGPTAVWTNSRTRWSASTSVAGSAGEGWTTGHSPQLYLRRPPRKCLRHRDRRNRDCFRFASPQLTAKLESWP